MLTRSLSYTYFLAAGGLAGHPTYWSPPYSSVMEGEKPLPAPSRHTPTPTSRNRFPQNSPWQWSWHSIASCG